MYFHRPWTTKEYKNSSLCGTILVFLAFIKNQVKRKKEELLGGHSSFLGLILAHIISLHTYYIKKIYFCKFILIKLGNIKNYLRKNFNYFQNNLSKTLKIKTVGINKIFGSQLALKWWIAKVFSVILASSSFSKKL